MERPACTLGDSRAVGHGSREGSHSADGPGVARGNSKPLEDTVLGTGEVVGAFHHSSPLGARRGHSQPELEDLAAVAGAAGNRGPAGREAVGSH